MLLGEHGVLHGGYAVVTAINQRISVTLTLRDDETIMVHSSLGKHQTTLSVMDTEQPFHFVMHAVRCFEPLLKQGFELTIISDFASDLGFGSSAAVLVATLGCLNHLTDHTLSNAQLYQYAMQALHTAQGRGSGADIVASLYGGILLYRTAPYQLERTTTPLSLIAIYCGYKTTTTEVIALVSERAKQNPKKYKQLYQTLSDRAKSGFEYIINNELRCFYNAISESQNVLSELGVSNSDIENIIQDCIRSGANTAKISGSGLGDCVVTFSEKSIATSYRQYPLRSEAEGLRHESTT